MSGESYRKESEMQKRRRSIDGPPSHVIQFNLKSQNCQMKGISQMVGSRVPRGQ